jgi:hypothetical protein
MNRQRLANTISLIKWRLRDKFRRYREAIAYARNRMNRSQANDIIYNCQAYAGWYPLETLSVDGCLQTALDCDWQDHPELESLVKSACARVAGKWESSGDAASAAEDWALDLVSEYAEARGIELARHEDNSATDPSETGQHEATTVDASPGGSCEQTAGERP